MALRTVTILASLVILFVIYIRAEGNQDKDVQVQSSHLGQVANAELHEALIRSRIIRSAGQRREKGRNKLKKRDPKSRKKPKTGKKKSKKVLKGRSKKKKSNYGKQTKPKKPAKKTRKQKNKKYPTKKENKNKTRKDKKRKRQKKVKRRLTKKECRKGNQKCKLKGKKRKGKGNKRDKKTEKDKKPIKKIKKQMKISKLKNISGKSKFKAAVCEGCVEKLATYAKLYVAQAKNRKQQILRMEAACKTSKKKVAKKELFDDPYQKLLANAGGNKSDPKCRGKSIGISRGSNDTQAADGAASAADLTILEACNKTIEVNCSSCQLDDPKVAKMAEDCKNAMVSFISKMDNCLNVSKYGNQAALCPCIDGIDDASKTLENQIRGCKWVTAASAQEVNNKKSCVGEFSKCRKAEDATVGHIHKCKLPLLKCGGVTTVAEAKTDLPILKNLKTELDATEDKMKKGFTNNNLAALNTANDSKTPSGLSDFIKNPSGGSRATSKCRQLAQAFLKFNQSAVGTGESANSDLNGTEASNTTDILKVMKTRDFDSEVANCQTSGKQQTTLYLIVRFYGATMILWRTTVVDVKILVLQLVISNAAAEDDTATTAAAGATTAAAGATTAAAGATTAAAGASTAAAGATTAAAVDTTAAAGATTAAAGANTAAAGATTAAAADTTAAVVVTAKAQGRKKKFLESMQWLKQKVLKA